MNIVIIERSSVEEPSFAQVIVHSQVSRLYLICASLSFSFSLTLQLRLHYECFRPFQKEEGPVDREANDNEHSC